MNIKIYVENKCYQCWLCKNRVGSDHHGLPECKVTQKYMYEVYEEPCHYFEPTERVKNLIMKSTDVAEVVHGEWKSGDCRCPVCGEDKFKGLDADIWSDWKPNYCPNCGADMRGGTK